MSDISRGEGWWQASDGKWYPPELHPERQVAEPSPESQPAPPPARVGPTPPAIAAPAGRRSLPVVALAVGAVVILGVLAYLLFRPDDDDDTAAPPATSSSSSSTSEPSSESSSESSPAPPRLTEAEARARLLTIDEIDGRLRDATFSRNTDPTLPCGTPNPDIEHPPTVDVGVSASANGVNVQEEIVVHADDASMRAAFEDFVAGHACTQGALSNSSGPVPLEFTTTDVRAELGVPQAVRIAFTAEGFHGELVLVRTERAVLGFAFSIADTADPALLPDPLTVVRKGLAKFDG